MNAPSHPLPQRPRMLALMVGRASANFIDLGRKLSSLGCEVACFRNVKEALGAPVFQKRDFCVLSSECADGDGEWAAQMIREQLARRWAPTLIAVRRDQEECSHALLGSGGDSTILLPAAIQFVSGLLSSLARFAAWQGQMNDHLAELERYFEQAEEENRTARRIMERFVQIDPVFRPVVDAWIAPAYKFSGDAVMVERSPDTSLKVLVADGMGHGLSAALNVLPLFRVFQKMVQSGAPSGEIVAGLNAAVRQELPPCHFVAATLVCIDTRHDCLEVWNGGCPPMLVIDPAGVTALAVESQELPLGVLGERDFVARIDRLALDRDSELLLCSDGVTEAENETRKAFGLGGLMKAVNGVAAGARLDATKLALVDHLGGLSAQDDLSIVIVNLAAATAEATLKLPPKLP